MRRLRWVCLSLLLICFVVSASAQVISPIAPQSPQICSTNPSPPTVLTFPGCCVINSGAVYCADSGGSAQPIGTGVVVGVIGDLNNVNTDANAEDDEVMVGDDTEYRGKILPACSEGTEKLHYNTATNAFTCVTDANTGASPLTPGSDGDSSTTNSPSGLELVGGFLTILRGCANRGTVEWNETLDRWECVDRYNFNKADSPSNQAHFGDGTDGWFIGLDTPGPFLNCVQDSEPCDVEWKVAENKFMYWTLNDVTQFTIDHNGDVTLGAAMEEVVWQEFPAATLEEDGTHCVFNPDEALNGAREQTVTCPDSGGTDAAHFFVKFNAPFAWDEAQVRFRVTLFQANGTPDGNMGLDLSLECVGHNEAWPGTQGAVTNLDFAVSGGGIVQNDLIVATSGDLSGVTCDPGDRVRAKVTIDDDVTTATAPQNIHFLSVDVLLNFNTWSN